MTVYVSEHSNFQRLDGFPFVTAPLAIYSLTSAGMSTGGSFPKPQAGCQFLRVTADAGSYLALVASTTGTLGPTNAFRVPPNAVPEIFAATTAFFVCAAST